MMQENIPFKAKATQCDELKGKCKKQNFKGIKGRKLYWEISIILNRKSFTAAAEAHNAVCQIERVFSNFQPKQYNKMQMDEWDEQNTQCYASILCSFLL